MATKKSQRIGIWIIAAVMLVGTVGGFIAMMFAPANEAKDQAAFEAAQKEYNEKVQEVTAKRDAQATEMGEKYFAEFSSYASRVGGFEAAGIDELKTEDLKVGDGDEVKDDTKLVAYYIGWNPSGEIFDQSIDGEKLKVPFAIDGPANATVIEGWKKGLIGMKIGGVRELTIPAAQAYGEAGSGEKIPTNTPLKFVIMAVAAPEEIADPEMPQALKDQYKRLYGIDL